MSPEEILSQDKQMKPLVYWSADFLVACGRFIWRQMTWNVDLA